MRSSAKRIGDGADKRIYVWRGRGNGWRQVAFGSATWRSTLDDGATTVTVFRGRINIAAYRLVCHDGRREETLILKGMEAYVVLALLCLRVAAGTRTQSDVAGGIRSPFAGN